MISTICTILNACAYAKYPGDIKKQTDYLNKIISKKYKVFFDIIKGTISIENEGFVIFEDITGKITAHKGDSICID